MQHGMASGCFRSGAAYPLPLACKDENEQQRCQTDLREVFAQDGRMRCS